MVRRVLGYVVAALAALLIAAPPATAQQNPSFNLVNRTDRTIERAFASPAGVTSWGSDRLGDAVLAPGQSFAVRLPADGNCLYDIRVEYQGGGADERRRVNTCGLTDVIFGAAQRAAPAQQQRSNDPSFRLVNRSQRQINEVYASPAGMTTWGQDRLGASEVIAPGATRVVRLAIDGNCIWDVRVVYADGSAAEKRRINLCNVTDLAFP